MSYSETKYVDEDGDVLDGETYHNPHGILAFVWGSLSKRYLEPTPLNGWIALRPFEDLWNGVADGSIKVEPFEHNVLHWTYDNALVRREDCAVLVASLRRFVEVHHTSDRICHLGAVADEIEREIADDPDWQATGLYGHSVSNDPWEVHTSSEEEPVAYNVNTGSKHWYVDVRPLGSEGTT